MALHSPFATGTGGAHSAQTFSTMNNTPFGFWRKLLLALLLSTTACNSHAWNSTGHRLGAAIAWQHLDDSTRDRITALLRTHPSWPHWLARSQSNASEPTAQAIFIAASTWADEWRHLAPRKSEEESTGITPLSDMSDGAHADWHYLNRPIKTNGRLGSGNLGGALDTALEHLSALLADPERPRQARAYALVWLIHLCGDAHQPLHTVSHLQADGSDDRGGNSLVIHDPDNTRTTPQTLHAWWDDLPGANALRGQKLLDEAQRLDTATPDIPLGSPQDWIRESQHIAQHSVYRGLNGAPPISLAPDYKISAKHIAEHQLVASGRRLAAWLETLLNTH